MGPKASVQLGDESLVERVMPHARKIAAAVVAIALILGVIFTIRGMKERGRTKDTAKIASVMAIAAAPIVAPPDPTNPDAKPAPSGYATRKDRAAAALAKLATTGAKVPAVVRGGLLAEAEKWDDAIAAYKDGGREPGIAGVLAREGEGLATEAKAEAEKNATARQQLLEQALAAFLRMQPDAAGDRHVYALYHQGRLQALLGKKADAKASFEKASPLAKGTSLESMIDDRLVDLEAHP